MSFNYVNHTVEFDLGWLAQLPSLQCVRTTHDVIVAHFPEQLSVLTQLTQLRVQNFLEGARVKFAVDWARLVMLQDLELGSRVTFSQSLSGLASLPLLKHVSLVMSDDTVPETAAQIALLAHHLGSIRPDVRFHTRAVK